jgi:putative transposase
MAHSFTSCLFHCVFSTKERTKIITADLRERLWPYMGGIARADDMKALAIGGVSDHAHLLLSLPSSLAIAKAIQLIKGNSSKWIHETFPNLAHFAWQEGYGAFSIGVSGIDATTAYINNQEEHHRHKSFQEEFLSFLQKQASNTIPSLYGDNAKSQRRSRLGISQFQSR